MTDAKVEVYLTQTCPFCMRAKKLLDKKGVAYEEIDVSDPADREIMKERADGRHTVPQVFINDQGIGGCDELFELEFDGDLDKMLGAD